MSCQYPQVRTPTANLCKEVGCGSHQTKFQEDFHIWDQSTGVLRASKSVATLAGPDQHFSFPEVEGFYGHYSITREVLEIMRSQLIFGALTYVRNRYELCQLASKAARKLHKPTTRLQDTMNDVLIRFHHSNPLGESAVPVEQVRKQERRAA